MQSLSVSPQASRLIVPDRLVTWLRWSIQKSYSLGAGTAASFRYRPTAAYDIDPLLGNTALPGLTELSTLYENYRVHESKIQVLCANTSSTVMPRLTVVALNDDPTSSPSTSIMTSWWDNPYSKSRDVPLVGGPPAIVTLAMTTKRIRGTNSVLYDIAYEGNAANGGIPANNWYWGVALVAPVTMAVAIPVTIDIWVKLEFYQRTRLLS